jgi:hypothetical protein
MATLLVIASLSNRYGQQILAAAGLKYEAEVLFPLPLG